MCGQKFPRNVIEVEQMYVSTTNMVWYDYIFTQSVVTVDPLCNIEVLLIDNTQGVSIIHAH